MKQQKQYPKTDHPVFYECGCCGHWHWQNLPGSVDCRDDAHRFTSDELDDHYGATKWEEITLDDQLEKDTE